MGLTVSDGSLVYKSGLLGTGQNCCCQSSGVDSCVTGCSIPSSLTLTLSYQSTSSGSPTSEELSAIQDIFDKSFVLDFDSIDLIGTAKYVGPTFPGTGNVSELQLRWRCASIDDPGVDPLAIEVRIRRCGYGGATYDTAQSSFFRLEDAPFFYIDAKSQTAWCSDPVNPAAHTFNLFFGTPTGAGCGTSPNNYMLIYEASVTI
jgi:hypothetical protein